MAEKLYLQIANIFEAEEAGDLLPDFLESLCSYLRINSLDEEAEILEEAKGAIEELEEEDDE